MSNLTNLENHNNLLTNINTTLVNIKSNIQNLPNYINTFDANATSSDITEGHTAYVNGVKVTGIFNTILQNKVVNPSTLVQNINADSTYYGLNVVTINGVNSDIDQNITANNIRNGINILGIIGNLDEGVNTSDANATINDIAGGKTAYVNGQKIVGNISEINGNSSLLANNVNFYTSPINMLKFSYNASDLLMRNGAGLYADDNQIATAIDLQPNQIKFGTSIFGVNGNVQSVSDTSINIMKYQPLLVDGGVPYMDDSVVYSFPYPSFEDMEYGAIVRPEFMYFSVLDKIDNSFKTYWAESMCGSDVFYDEDNNQLRLYIDASFPEGTYCSILQLNNNNVLPEFSHLAYGYNSKWFESLSAYSWNTFNMVGSPTNLYFNLLDNNLEFYIGTPHPSWEYETGMAVSGQIRENYMAYDKFGRVINGSMPTRTTSSILNTKIVPSTGNINISPRLAGYYTTTSILQINNLGLASKIGLTADKLKSGESILDITGNYAGDNFKVYNGMKFAYSNVLANNVSEWDISDVTDMSKMFYECAKISDLNISNWNVSNVTNMSRMFLGCSNLINMNIGNWNVSNVINISGMFDECINITAINISNWNVSNVTDIEGMLAYCRNLTNISVSNWNTSNVVRMSRIFEGCDNLVSIDISNWDTSNVTGMARLFGKCNNLVNIDVSNWNVSNVVDLVGILEYCNNLSDASIDSIINMCINATNSAYKNLSNSNYYSPFRYSNITSSRYQHRVSEITAAGWTY